MNLQLENLRENVKFWQYKFDTCTPKDARAMHKRLLDAKQTLQTAPPCPSRV